MAIQDPQGLSFKSRFGGHYHTMCSQCTDVLFQFDNLTRTSLGQPDTQGLNLSRCGVVPYNPVASLLVYEAQSGREKAERKKQYARNLESKKTERLKNARKQNSANTPPKKPSKLQHQFGISQVRSLVLDSLEKPAYNLAENLLVLFFGLRDCTTVLQASSMLFLFFKSYYSESICHQLMAYLSQECDIMLTDYVDSQRGTQFCTQSGLELPDWLKVMRDISKSWALARCAPAFKKLSKLLSLCGSIGLCNLSNFNFSLKGLSLFSPPVLRSHVNATDFISAVLETIEYFCRGGYECFKRGDCSYFLYADVDAKDFEDDYHKILEMSTHVRPGNLENFMGIDDNDYSLLLDETIEKARGFVHSLSSGWEKKILSDRLTTLLRLRADFVAYRTDGKLRNAPFCIYIEGTSGVGKSTTSALLMRTLLKCNGYDASDKRVVVVNADDKYLSNYNTSINGVFLDDFGNTKAEFVQESPTSKIIQMMNNVPAYAVMAEADMKGKVSIEPKVVILTSNVPMEIIGSKYSNNPLSIVRRAHFHLSQRVRPEFCRPGTTMLDPQKMAKFPDSDVFPDVWLYTVREVLDSGGSSSQPLSYTTHLEDADLRTVVLFLIEKSKNHFIQQRRLVEMSRDLDTKICLCSLCSRPSLLCGCKQFGSCLFDNSLLDTYRAFCNSPFTAWTTWVPEFIFENPVVQSYLCYCHVYNIHTFAAGACSFLLSCLLLACGRYTISILVLCLCLYICALRIYQKQRAILIRLREERNIVPVIFRSIRDVKLSTLLYSSVAVASLYKLCSMYRKFGVLQTQGNVAPASMAEAMKRDSEKNPWRERGVDPVPMSDLVRANTLQLRNVMIKNTLYARFVDCPDGVGFCNVVFMESNLALLPTHMWYADELNVEFYKDSVPSGAHKLQGRALLSRSHSCDIPNTDLTLVYVPSCGSWKNITKFLPSGHQGSVAARMIYRQQDSNVLEAAAMLTYHSTIRVGDVAYPGHKYQLPFDTFKGMCMAPWVSESKPSYIVGFHLAGKGTEGASCALTMQQYLDARLTLESIPSILLCASDGTLPLQQYEVQFFQGPLTHPKSCLNYLSTDSTLRIYGSVDGASTYRSTVVSTPISRHVERIMGVPNNYGPPQFHPWRPWNEYMQVVSSPTLGVNSSHLVWATRDYLSSLLDILRKEPQAFRPLTIMQCINGIDGKRFIDRMPPNTSCGYPINKPKKDFLIYLDPEVNTEFSCPATFHPIILNEVERMRHIYLSGERCYPIFKASLKDEPTRLDKDKVRVFQGAPVAFQILLRQYFLPVCRFLSLFPLVSECAVGINAQGPEWDQMSRHLTQHGHDRILAGDYKSYDQKIAAQLNLAAFSILCTLAERTGEYTQDDLTIMRGLATDVCYPVTAINGDLVQLLGSSPSGHNLTVYINSIDNSLLQRCAYFATTSVARPNKPIEPFRSNVSLISYGDDVKGSVRSGYDHYNHVSAAAYFRQYGIVFTMPDKESAPIPYMQDSEVDFLKRKNVHNLQLNIFFGALDESSIFKSLHCVNTSTSVTLEEQSANNIDGALRELFAYGREHYELRRSQFKQVAEAADITHFCRELHVNYEERLQKFCDQYAISH